MRAIAAIGAVAVLASCGQGDGGQWVVAQRGDLVFSSDVTGTLKAVDSTDIAPPHIPETWSFKIARMAPEGSAVKKGDPLISFDPSAQARTLLEMRAKAGVAQKKLDNAIGTAAMAARDGNLAIAQAEAKLRAATLEADMDPQVAAANVHRQAILDKQLAEKELAYAKDHADETAQKNRADIKALREDLTYYESRVHAIESSIASLNIVAPRAGTVVYPTDENGEKKQIGDTVWQMQTAISVVSLDHMTGAAQIDEADASKVKTGQRVRLRLDAHPTQEIIGHVESIERTVSEESDTVRNKVVRLTVALEQTHELALSPGMRFRGKVETGRAGGVILIPLDAVFATAKGPVAYGKDGEAVPLSLGRRSGDRIEVRDGLSPGDEIARRGGGAP
ncbi:MAG TPA: HlyD family efflux transporter periplasmic adaptor subunit [Kofleriaceae bacterium]|nr:HlyD family efflux transporter periplasmic adaptor subunit [Kofleriaceae bacterium]